MTKEEWAARLNGREIYNEISSREEREALSDGAVIVFGASDDLMELRGAIDDEMGCYEGGTAYFDATGMLMNECGHDGCPYFEKAKLNARKVRAIWDKDGYSWVYETEIPHATFDIMEDGEKYCRGIVFNLADVK